MSTADEVELNAAIAAMSSGGSYYDGGLVTLSLGDFITAAPIVLDRDGIWLQGQGRHGTCISPGASFVHTRTGVVDSILGYTMTDADGAFDTLDIGKVIINTTGTDQYALITERADATTITLDKQIFAAGNTWIIVEHGMVETSGTPYYCKVSDMYIDGRHGSYASACGLYGQFRRGLISGMLVGECAGHGMHFHTSGGTKVLHSYVYQNEGAGVVFGNGASDSWITDCGLNGNRNSGLICEVSGIQCNHIHTAANYDHGVDLGPIDELYRTVVHNVYFDKNYKSSVNVTGHAVYGLTLTGCEFWGAGRLYLGAWGAGVDYVIGNLVTDGGGFYYCFKANGPSTAVYQPGVTAGWQGYWSTLTATPCNFMVYPHSGALRSTSIGDNHWDSLSYVPYNINFAGAATTHVDVCGVGNNFHQVYPPLTADINVANAGTGNQKIHFIGNVPSSVNREFTSGVSIDSVAVADEVAVGGYDISAGHRAFAFSSEEVAVVAAAGASDVYVPVRYNGTTYKWLLHT